MKNSQCPSVSELQKLTLVDLEKLVRSNVGHATRRWLMLGRCLLVLGQEGRIALCGCSGTAQYAGLLGIKPQDATECKRVALCLESLPLLREAAEAGTIGWGSLCEVTQKATAETDARWLELCGRYTFRIIKKLVEATPRGEVPCDPDLVPVLVPEESWLHFRLPSYVVSMFQRALRLLSLQAGTPLSAAHCLDLVLAEFLAGTGTDSIAVEKLRKEAKKDVAARRSPTGQQMLLEAEQRPRAEQSSANEDEEPQQIPFPADDEALQAPLAALAARGAICPSDPKLRLAVPDTNTQWENPRLRFSAEARLATPAQRLEMLRRDGYCCSVPGCPNRLWLDLHHVVFYCQGGVTLPDNLIVVCTNYVTSPLCDSNRASRITVDDPARAPAGASVAVAAGRRERE